MKTIKINAKGAGKWADPDTTIPQIIVEAGDQVEVSNALADLMCPTCAKDITADLAKAAAKQAKDAVAVEEKIAELKAQAEALISAMELDVTNYNLAGDSEVLAVLVAKLTDEQEAMAEAEKKVAAAKTPATKDKAAAESK